MTTWKWIGLGWLGVVAFGVYVLYFTDWKMSVGGPQFSGDRRMRKFQG